MATPHRLRAGSSAGYLRSIADGGLTSPQAITQILTSALNAEDYDKCVRDLRSHNIDPQSYIDGLDKVCSGLSYSLPPSAHILLVIRPSISSRQDPIFTNDVSER